MPSWWIWDPRQWSPLFDCFTRSVHPFPPVFVQPQPLPLLPSSVLWANCFVLISSRGWVGAQQAMDMEAHCTMYSLFSKPILQQIGHRMFVESGEAWYRVSTKKLSLNEIDDTISFVNWCPTTKRKSKILWTWQLRFTNHIFYHILLLPFCYQNKYYRQFWLNSFSLDMACSM